MGNYNRLRTYTPGQVLKYVSLNPEDKPKVVNFNNQPVFMGSKRYQNFKAHGLVCVECGLEGKYFALEQHKGQRTNKYHFNLYGIDENGKEVMLTKDHIKPKAKGGTDELSNFQPMCARCNAAKGDNWLSPEQLIHQARIQEVQEALKGMERATAASKARLRQLVADCPHDVSYGSTGRAECKICGKKFGWYCSDSPDKSCHYYPDGEDTNGPFIILNRGGTFPLETDKDTLEDFMDECSMDSCLFCGQPEERK